MIVITLGAIAINTQIQVIIGKHLTREAVLNGIMTCPMVGMCSGQEEHIGGVEMVVKVVAIMIIPNALITEIAVHAPKFIHPDRLGLIP